MSLALFPSAPAPQKIEFLDRAPYFRNLPEDGEFKVLHCQVEIAPKVFLHAYRADNSIWISWAKERVWGPKAEILPVETDPFVQVDVVGPANPHPKFILAYPDYLRRLEIEKSHKRNGDPNYHFYSYYDSPPYSFQWYDCSGIRVYAPFLLVHLRISAPGMGTIEKTLNVEIPQVGSAVLTNGRVDLKAKFLGYSYTFKDWASLQGGGYGYGFIDRWVSCLTKQDLPQGKDFWWQSLLDHWCPKDKVLDTSRVKSWETKKTIQPNLEKLSKEEPLLFHLYRALHDGRTRDKTSNNALLASMLEAVGSDYAALKKALEDTKGHVSTFEDRHFYGDAEDAFAEFTRELCKALPGASDRLQADHAKAKASKEKGQKQQGNLLGISEEKHPKLHAAVTSGAVPLNVFHQPDKTPVNREFSLWERAFERGWDEALSQIATNASGRSTYEKDITPYLAFLFRIEKFLDRHAPGPTGWKAQPKFVSSSWQLEMDEPSEDGTVKRRSAFTPVADNETRTITVPYVAVSVSGARTTWCYSRFYHLFEEGFLDPEAESVVERDLEEKLNGRDDYGLMYFTLTGTSVTRGYPTFLIIFERLKDKTRVHFHRVHPSRKRGEEGTKTLACDLVEECYRYMAGNIRAEEITAQQGDLLFIRVPEGQDPLKTRCKIGDPIKVTSFESHAFVPMEGPALTLYPNETKGEKNRLGFLHSEVPFHVEHPEHENIEKLEAGWWEVRRCRSWEANPRAIWSYTID